jgi:hypothetical protein
MTRLTARENYTNTRNPFLTGFTVFPQAIIARVERKFFRARTDAFLLREHSSKRDKK